MNVGDTVEDFSALDQDGNTVTLSDLLAEGPLVLFFWGNKWTLGAWCELRGALRSFRVDLVQTANLQEETFEDIEGRNLASYVNYSRGNR